MWVDSFAVVKFDDELGQVVAHECPEESVRRLRWRGGAPRPHAPRRQLSSRDQRDLAFAAMPDSHSGGSELDMAYVFAMRPAEDRPGHSAQTRLAFTYFRRIREPASARGYRQTSVVLLTALPFHSLFLKVVRRLGRLYFAFGLPILEVAMATLDAWCAALRPLPTSSSPGSFFPTAAGGREGALAPGHNPTHPPPPPP